MKNGKEKFHNMSREEVSIMASAALTDEEVEAAMEAARQFARTSWKEHKTDASIECAATLIVGEARGLGWHQLHDACRKIHREGVQKRALDLDAGPSTL